MKTTLKVIGGFVLVVLVLVVIAVVALPMLVDPQDVKDQISAEVKKATGRELSIPGEVKLSVFPWLGATLGKVSLGNAAGFSAPVFASTEKVDVRVKLMPLLDRRVEMSTVTVHGLTLNLERNKAGKGNWEDLGAGGKGGEKGGAGGTGGQQLAGFAIGGLDVREGALSFTDAQAGKSYSLRNVTLTTGVLTPGTPVDLELGFDLDSADPPIKGRVTGSAKLDGDPGTKIFSASGLAISADMTGETLPGGKASASLGADVTVDGTKQTAAVRNLVLKLLDLSASGALEVTGLDASPAYSGELAVASFSPRKLMQGLGMEAPETADPEVLGNVALSATISGGADAVTLKPLSVTLDGSTLSGEAQVSNFSAPAVRFALSLDAIDLDRYLPPGSEVPPVSPGAAAGKAGELPLETLRALNVAGNFKAGKVKVAKLNVSDVDASLNAKGGVIRLSPVSAKLYQGSYAGNIGLDAGKDVPLLSLDEKLSGVQIAPLLRDLQGEEPISGTANLSAKLTARGTAPEAVKRSLNGDLSFQFLDGALNGVNIGKMIRDATAALKGGSASGGDEPAKTDFAEIVGTAKVTNGVVVNDDLSAKSPLLRIVGKGTASLPEETLDYRTTVTLVATSKGQGGKALSDLEGVPIPLRITGTFTQPSYALDTAGLAKAVAQSKAKDLIDEQKGKVTEKLEETVKEKGGESVEKLLGGDKGAGGLLKGLLPN